MQDEKEQSEKDIEENIPNDDAERESEEKSGVFQEVLSWVKTIVSAVIVAWVITTFLIVNANVPTGSMETTIMPNDRIIANRLQYKLSNPKRFDIVVFKYPDDESVLYIKRVIGLPGETITIRDGKVYVDDSEEPLDDSFIKEEMLGSWGPYTVPEGCYFMLGDNRNNSKDSRYWNKTFVEKDKILGKAIFRYFPSPKLLN
jgi:signal peptidase I